MSYHSKIIPSRATEHSKFKGGPSSGLTFLMIIQGFSENLAATRNLCKVYAGQWQTPAAAFSCSGLTVAAWHHVSARSTVWAAQLQRRVKVMVFPSACLDAQP